MKTRYVVSAFLVMVGLFMIGSAILRLYKFMGLVCGISLIAFGLYLVIGALVWRR